jgi:hypothetical protein
MEVQLSIRLPRSLLGQRLVTFRRAEFEISALLGSLQDGTTPKNAGADAVEYLTHESDAVCEAIEF